MIKAARVIGGNIDLIGNLPGQSGIARNVIMQIIQRFREAKEIVDGFLLCCGRDGRGIGLSMSRHDQDGADTVGMAAKLTDKEIKGRCVLTRNQHRRAVRDKHRSQICGWGFCGCVGHVGHLDQEQYRS